MGFGSSRHAFADANRNPGGKQYTNIHANGYSYRHGYFYCYGDCDIDGYFYCNGYRDSHRHGNCYGDFYRNSHCDSNCYSDCDDDRNTYCDAAA